MRYFRKEWYRNRCRSENIVGVKEYLEYTKKICLNGITRNLRFMTVKL